MLNRLYIWLGVILIIVISAAFIAPRFFDWSGTRPRMEKIASEALGADVTIAGDIDFVLLPQPRLTFGKVVVGPADAPFVEIASAEADFSLMDFLRDRFVVTRLVLQAPQLRFTIDEQGRFLVPIHLPETVSASNVSIADASIDEGTLRLEDKRTGNVWRMLGVAGTLKLSALRGPFGFNATATYEGLPYQLRVTTSQMNAEGAMQMAAFLRPENDNFSMSAEGVLQTGSVPSFVGSASVRQKPILTDSLDDVRGDIVFDANFEADSARVRLGSYTLLPDENRAGTRLTGAAIVRFGENPDFEAVVSGGVVALTARDARAANDNEPYEFLRLMTELQAPFLPPIPGRIGVDVAELDLRALSMREVRVDATTNGKHWDIENFTAKLSGDSALSLSGRVTNFAGWPEFEGRIALETERLDAIAQLWRRPAENSPLFGVSSALSSQISFLDKNLAFEEGRFVLDGVSNDFSANMDVDGGDIDVRVQLGALDDFQSRVLGALLPELTTNTRFNASFARASFDVSAEAAVLGGLEGRNLAARGVWTPSQTQFSQLSAGYWGGAGFTLSGVLSGGLSKPNVWGGGRVILQAAAAQDVLPYILDFLKATPEVRAFANRSLPANIDIDLTMPEENGGQKLAVDGQFGAGDLQVSADLSGGVMNFRDAPLRAHTALAADDPDALLAQLGIPIMLEGNGPAKLTLAAEGAPLNSLDVQLTYDSAEEKLSYTGNAIVSDFNAIRGRGVLAFELDNPSIWGEWLGTADIHLPKISGVAQIGVAGTETLTLSAINARAGESAVTGTLTRIEEAGVPIFGGELVLDAVDVAGGLAIFGGGAAASHFAGGIWPDGPFAFAHAKRTSRGRIKISAPKLASADTVLAREVGFDLVWNPTNLRVSGLRADLGGGKVSFDLSFCCSGAQANRQISGRAGLSGVEIASLLPNEPGSRLGGKVTGSLHIEGTDENFAAIIDASTGEGSFTISDLVIEGFDPDAFLVAAGAENILGLDADQLREIVARALAEGAFAAQEMSGVFNIAGGTFRAANLAAENETARLFGGLSLDLADLALVGSWTLLPVGTVGDTDLINETTSRITAILGGTLAQPTHELDLAQMVDGIKVRAFELEVVRLEKLRAEDEARARAAAAERARLMALEAQRQLEEELAKAAAEEERLRQLQLEQEEEAQNAIARLLQELGESGDPLVNNDTVIVLEPPQEPDDSIQLLPGQ